MREVRRKIRRPFFIGQLADAARERVLRRADTLKAYEIANAVRLEAGAEARGTFVKVVRVAGRTAVHTGPFPVSGYEVLDTMFVADFDPETGAVVLTRPAYHPACEA